MSNAPSLVDLHTAYAFNEMLSNSGASAIRRDQRSQDIALGILENHFDKTPNIDLSPFEQVRDLIELTQDARVDPLMRIPNRRALDEQMLATWAHYMRDKINHHFTFGIVDIDNFKYINDRYGHQAGDQLLKEIARSFANAIRRSDLVARWGGDELAIILSDIQKIDSDDKNLGVVRIMVVVNTEVNTFVSRMGWEWPGNNVNGANTHFSLGLVEMRGEDDSPDSIERLVDLADQRAAEDKQGRNVRRGV